MNKKITYIVFALLVLGIGGLFLSSFLIKKAKNQNVSDTFFALFKSRCEVFYNSPYIDPAYNFSIAFTDDQLPCLLKDDTGQNHEVYLWQRDVLESETINVSFQEAILGKVTIEPRSDIGAVDESEPFTTTIDGEVVNGEIITSKACETAECPKSRRVILERFGKMISIEEYNRDLNLFEHIHFGEER